MGRREGESRGGENETQGSTESFGRNSKHYATLTIKTRGRKRASVSQRWSRGRATVKGASLGQLICIVLGVYCTRLQLESLHLNLQGGIPVGHLDFNGGMQGVPPISYRLGGKNAKKPEDQQCCHMLPKNTSPRLFAEITFLFSVVPWLSIICQTLPRTSEGRRNQPRV